MAVIMFLVHEVDPNYRTAKGKVWGSDEVNVEGWRPLKRLPGHESGEYVSHTVHRMFNRKRQMSRTWHGRLAIDT